MFSSKKQNNAQCSTAMCTAMICKYVECCLLYKGFVGVHRAVVIRVLHSPFCYDSFCTDNSVTEHNLAHAYVTRVKEELHPSV
jgi:hypothetical protein